MERQAVSFLEMWGQWELYGFIAASESHDLFRELQALQAADERGNGQLLWSTLEDTAKAEILRAYAARCRTVRGSRPVAAVVEVMADILRHETGRPHLRAAAVEALYRLNEVEATQALITALVQVEEPPLQRLIAYAAHHQSRLTWQEKTERLLRAVAQEGLAREHLDVPALLYAIRPPLADLKQERYLLADHLNGQAAVYYDNELMTGVLAAFLIESTGRNLDRANGRVRHYLERQPDDERKLKGLRAEMNSQLTPAELETRLQKSFHQPLDKMNEQIHEMWQGAIRQAQRTVAVRVWLGSLLFVLALVLLVGSVVRYLADADRAREAVFGSLLAAGLLAIATFYSGVLRHSRQLLADVGIANAVYAAYVQRTLAISNAFGRLYLQGKVEPATIKESNELIGKALEDTVKALRTERVASLEELLKDMGIE